jgi:hypothetical protein
MSRELKSEKSSDAMSIPKLPGDESETEADNIDLPGVPKGNTASPPPANNVEPDFDDLAKRFEELKKKR